MEYPDRLRDPIVASERKYMYRGIVFGFVVALATAGCNLSDPLAGDGNGPVDTERGSSQDGSRDSSEGADDTGTDEGADTERPTSETGVDTRGDTVAARDTAEDIASDTTAVDIRSGDTGARDSGGVDADSGDTRIVDSGTDDTSVVDSGTDDTGLADTSDTAADDTDGGVDGSDADACSPSPETCNGVDDDCDGKIDEGTDTVVLTEDFEGSDPLGWSEYPPNPNRLKIDDDATQNPAEGSEYGKAWYRTGTCESVAGMAASKSISGDVDRITLQLNVDIDNWGRAALFVRDSAGNTTTIWSANAKGNGFTTNGWKTVTFDHTTSSSTTKSSGAVVEINPIPSGLGNETVTFIFGNNDDSSMHCDYLDHGWTTRVDDVEVVDVCN